MTATSNPEVVCLHPRDNICVAARDLPAGAKILWKGHPLSLPVAVPFGHKIAVLPIARREPVRKYGQTIGLASQPIQPGDWVHLHNLALGEFGRDYATCSEIPPPPPPILGRSFRGYRRADGRAGTRNYVAVISTANCSASVSKYIARRCREALLHKYPNVDGVVALTHSTGCGIQHGGLAHQMLNRVLRGLVRHPNIAGCLLVGLGCEQVTVADLLPPQILSPRDSAARPAACAITIQDAGGTSKAVEEGLRRLAELLPRANDARREPIPASELVLGTECGGSDGNSGITANPALGVAADMIVACGGTTILSEIPEIYGAEHLLTRRSVSPGVADKLIARIQWWRWYLSLFGAEFDSNPSLGNKEGGLTTIAEKSLGAIAKAGSTALVDVYEYAEPVTARGFVVMDTPGYDPPSVTGLVAGGANVVVFTTGRGSCYGCQPVPSIKVASNTPMYERLIDDMDLNAGEILRGQPVEQVGRQIFEAILAVASGEKTKSERHGIGEEEFVPWIVGPTL